MMSVVRKCIAILICMGAGIYLTVLGSAPSVYAQEESVSEEDTWYLGKPISVIEFKGLNTISKLDMNNVLLEYKNQELTLDLLLEIQNVLYALDFFDEITPEAQRSINDQLVLIFHVKEKPAIGKISFVGNEYVGNSVLQGALFVRKGEIFNDFKAQDEVETIRQKYFEQGFPEVNVSYRIKPMPNQDDEIELIFIIDEGGRITVSEISFVGNELFKENKLKRTILTKKKSIVRKGTFSEAYLEEDKDLIHVEYYKRGYIAAEVVDVIVEKSPNPKSLNTTDVQLTYVIEEGTQYTFDSISFEGNVIYDSEELLKLFPLKTGNIMDLTRFQRGYDRVRLKYADQGFIFNVFDYEMVLDEEVNSVSFIVKIQEGGQSHIENIIITGNIKTKDYVIRRVLGLQEGDVFSASALNYSRYQLLGTRYFKSVVPDSRPGSTEGLIDLIFNLEEDRTRDIRVGLTFGGSSEFPLSLFLSWNQPNLAGRGLQLNTQVVASPLEQSISASFREPRVLSSPFAFSTTLSFSHELVRNTPQDLISPIYDPGETDVNYDPYTGHYVFTSSTTYNGVSYNAGDPFPGNPTSEEISQYNLRTDYEYYGTFFYSPYNNSLMEYDNYRISWTVGTGYVYNSPLGALGTSVSIGPTVNYVYYDKYIYRPANLQVRKNLENWKVYNIFSIKGYYDGRDLSYIPTSGAYLSQQFVFYGGLLLGDAHFIRSTTVTEAHVKLLDWAIAESWSWKIVLAGQSVFTAIFPQFFYPEGTSYEEDGPSYVQKLDLNGLYNARGWPRIRNGEATWNSWIELRMPLYETVLWWDQFFEVSRLWVDLDEVAVDTDPTQYQFAFGTGVRFVLQQFPVRIYVAKRFSLDENYNPVWQRGNLAGSSAEEGSGVDLVFTLGFDFF